MAPAGRQESGAWGTLKMLAARRMMNRRSAPTPTRWSIASDKAVNVSGFDAAILADTGSAFSDISADLDPGTGEVSLVFAAAKPYYADGMFDSLFLKVHPNLSAGPGLYRGVRDASGDADILIQGISALTTAANYQVTASGSTLTVKQNGTTVATVALTGWNAAMLNRSWVGLRGQHGVGISADNFTANGGAVQDTFTRADNVNIGNTETGQPWIANFAATRPTSYSHHPTDVSGLIWWLKGDGISGVSNGSAFGTWPDDAGSNDATQSTGSLQPVYLATYMNGLPAVEFDGADDYMLTALSQASGDLTAFFVISPDSSSNFGNYLFDTQTGRLVLADNVSTSGGHPGWYDGSWHQWSGLQVFGEACVLEYNLASGSGVLYRNDQAILSASYTQQAIGGAVALASSYDGTPGACFDGRISEVIIYDHALGGTDRAKVDTYLREKYGFSL